MLWIPLLFVIVAVIFIIVSIILDFMASDRALQGNTNSAHNFSIAAAFLSIAALIIFLVGFIIALLIIHSGGGTTALGHLLINSQEAAQVLAKNPELLNIDVI